MAQPPMKKPKVNGDRVHLDALRKIQCSLPEDISPGSYHRSRLAVKVSSNSIAQIYASTGNTVYRGQFPLDGDAPHARGLGGVYLPSTSQEAVQVQGMDFKLPGEIQNLCFAHSEATCLCAVDCHGEAVLQFLDDLEQPQAKTVHLSSPSLLETGWAGIAAWDSGGGMLSAVASHYGACLTIYQEERIIRRLGTLNRPNAIAAVKGSHNILIAMAETGQVTLWDPRVSEKRGCVTRMSPGGSDLPLYAVAADSSGTFLAAGGVESTAFIFDVRKAGQPFDRWPGCVKHDIVSLHFPASRSDHIFVAGADQNLRCGLVNSKARKTAQGSTPQNPSARGQRGEGGISFRGDSRWLGVARDSGKDLLACLTASNSIILANFSFA